MSAWMRGPNVVRAKDGVAMINYISLGVPARLTAPQINEIATDPYRQKVSVLATGKVARIGYGRVDMAARLVCSGIDDGDLVQLWEWCLGEIEEVEAITIDGAAAPGGVSVTHYMGTTTQTANADIAAAISGYTDTLVATTPGGQVGMAYTVLRIPTAATSLIPKNVHGIIKGRKCWDERTSSWVYTTTPALHLYDLLTAPVHGIGMSVVGAAAVANRNEELLGGNPRNSCGILLDEPREALAWAALLAEYADCFLTFEGGGIRLIPDAPVTEPLFVFDDSNIIEGSFVPAVGGLRSAPTEYEVKYTDSNLPATPWPLASAIARLPGVEAGTVVRRPTAINMAGIHDHAHAFRTALGRLNAAQVAAMARWQSRDIGRRLNRGDPVQVINTASRTNRIFRIGTPRQIGHDLFEYEGREYTDTAYPDDVVTPGGTFSVPVGVVAILLYGSVPSGWAAFTDADDRLIRGTDSDYAGTTGGSNSITVSGSTGSVSSHVGASAFPVFTGDAGTDQGAVIGGTDIPLDAHSHTYSQSVTVNPLRRSFPLVIKTGSPGTLIPKNLMVLSPYVLSNPSMARVVADIAGRFLGAASAVSSAGSASQAVGLAYSPVADHNHRTIGQRVGSAFGFPAYLYEEAGAHNHADSQSVTLAPNVKRRQVAAYTGLVDFPCIPGMVFMWPGDISSIPANFALCDGTGSTVDMTDHYVELVTGTPGGAGGNNTASWTGSTDTVYHNHQGASATHETPTTTALHAADHWHSHTVDGSVAYTPPFLRIPFIQCTGS